MMISKSYTLLIILLLFLGMTIFVQAATLNVSISYPANLQQIITRSIFNITSKITCLVGACGNVFATPRFNVTGLFPFAPLNGTVGEGPLSPEYYIKSIWNRTYNPGGTDIAHAIKMDNESNAYVVGTKGNADWFIMKLNSTGGSIWNRTYNFSAGSFDVARNIALDNSSNLYVVGEKNFTIAKLNSTGGSIWNRTYLFTTGVIKHNPYDIVLDNSSNIYAAGDERISKLNSDGASIWNRTANWSNINGIDIDNAENIYVTGYVTIGSIQNVNAIKYNSAGTLIWNRTYGFPAIVGGAGNDNTEDIAIGKDRSVYVTGSFDLSGSAYDWLIMKMDTNGNSIWNKTWQFTGNNQAFDIILDHRDDVYVVGNRDTSTNFGISKLSSGGVSIWNRTYSLSATSEDTANSIVLDKNNDMYIAGQVSNVNWGIMKFSNNLIYQACGSLILGQSCSFTWKINATRSLNSSIGIYYNSSTANLINVTDNRTIIVVASTFVTTTTTTSSTTTSVTPSQSSGSSGGAQGPPAQSTYSQDYLCSKASEFIEDNTIETIEGDKIDRVLTFTNDSLNLMQDEINSETGIISNSNILYYAIKNYKTECIFITTTTSLDEFQIQNPIVSKEKSSPVTIYVIIGGILAIAILALLSGLRNKNPS